MCVHTCGSPPHRMPSQYLPHCNLCCDVTLHAIQEPAHLRYAYVLQAQKLMSLSAPLLVGFWEYLSSCCALQRQSRISTWGERGSLPGQIMILVRMGSWGRPEIPHRFLPTVAHPQAHPVGRQVAAMGRCCPPRGRATRPGLQVKVSNLHLARYLCSVPLIL
jgi:hypothetical protein